MMSLAWFLLLNKKKFFYCFEFFSGTSKYDLVKHFVSPEDGLGIFFSVYYDFTKNGGIYMHLKYYQTPFLAHLSPHNLPRSLKGLYLP